MKSALFGMEFTPLERRILVAVLAVIVVLLNAVFVWPHFKDWDRLKGEIFSAEKTLKTYQEAAALLPQYEARKRELEQQGSEVLTAEQSLHLARTVQDQGTRSNVAITNTRLAESGGSNTNTFFDEKAVVISVNAGDKELIEFLLALGSGTNMIRVRDMDLRADGSFQRLNGSMTLVASYHKKAKPANAAPAAAGLNRPTSANPSLRRKT